MSRRAVLVILAAFFLILAALAVRNGDLALLALPFLAYLAGGILRAPGEVRLRAERTLSQAFTVPSTPVEVRVTVTNEGPALANLLLADTAFPGVTLVEGRLSRRVALRSGEQAELQYTLQAGRGRLAWKSLRVEASDPFGLLPMRLDLPAAAELIVRPEAGRLQHVPLAIRETIHAAGPVPARLAGPGVDFWAAREYQPGDPLRWVIWRRLARDPGKLFTKEFEKHEIADVGLILDARQVLDLPGNSDSLFEHSIRAAASLADTFLREGNRVSLLVFGDTLTRVFPGYGKRQLNRILSTLAGVTTGANISIESLKYLPIRLFPSRSQIIFVSPLAPTDGQAIIRLRALGYNVMLVSPDPVEFSARSGSKGEANDLAVRAARLERCLLLQGLRRAGIQVVSWRVDQPLNDALRLALVRLEARRNIQERVL